MLEPEPPEIEGEDMGGIWDRDLYRRTHDARRAHMFRYRWLKMALPPAEFAALAGVKTTMLRGLYPHVFAGGPGGDTWYRQMKKMKSMLDEPDRAQAFVADFIRTYQHVDKLLNMYDPVYAPFWDWAEQNMIPVDTDTLLDPLKHLFGETATRAGLPPLYRDEPTYREFSNGFDTYTIVCALEVFAPTAVEHGALAAKHHTFVAKYDL